MAKFIRFDNDLINVDTVQNFTVVKPVNESQRWSVKCDADQCDWDEYFDSEREAKSRLDAIYSELQSK